MALLQQKEHEDTPRHPA